MFERVHGLFKSDELGFEVDYVVLELEILLLRFGELLLQGGSQLLDFFVLLREQLRQGRQEFLLDAHPELFKPGLLAILQFFKVAFEFARQLPLHPQLGLSSPQRFQRTLHVGLKVCNLLPEQLFKPFKVLRWRCDYCHRDVRQPVQLPFEMMLRLEPHANVSFCGRFQRVDITGPLRFHSCEPLDDALQL